MPTRSYVTLPAAMVHVVEHGGQGQPVLLIHGLGGASTNWMAVGAGLSAFGRVLAIDLPGFGLSPPVPRCDLGAHSDVVIDALQWAGGGRSVLVGNSMGGLVVELVAARRPDLVERLVLVAPATPLAPRSLPVDLPLIGLLAAQSVPGLGRFITGALLDRAEPDRGVARMLAVVAADPRSVPDAVVAAAVRLAESRRTLPWVNRAYSQSIASIRSLLFPRDRFVRLISRIESPALLISGSRDRLVSPASIDWLSTLRPDWRRHRFERLGHVPHMEEPESFLGVVTGYLRDRAHA